jgi:polar amino acid transport system substrate-binding protein
LSARRSATAAIFLVAAATLVLAGCASSKSGNNNASSPAQAGGGGTPSSTNTLNAQLPSSIKSKGSILFAMDATYPPDESIGKDGHTIEGFDADLGKALAQVLGVKADEQNVKFDNIIPGLQDGKYDVGLSSFTDTKEREKVVDFVTYFQAGEAFYVKAGSAKKYTSVATLCGAKVAVENGTTEQTEATAQKKKCSLQVLSFGDQNQANLAVSSGRADVGFLDSQVAGAIVKSSNGQFELSGSAFEVAPYGIALPKGTAMTQVMLAAVKQLMTDGTYTKILQKWGLTTGAITAPVVNGAQS